MKKLDEAAQEHIESLETDNDHLRIENEALAAENLSLKAELIRYRQDREYCAA